MSAHDLHAGLYLNATPWEKALASARAKADHFAEHVEYKLGKKLSHLLGAGAVVGAIYGPLHEVFKGVLDFGKNAEDIEKGSNKLGITTDEFQQLEKAAKEAGMSTEEYIDAVKKGDIPLNKALHTIREMNVEMDANTLANQKATQSSLEKAGAVMKEAYARIVNGLAGAAQVAGSISVHGWDPEKIKKDLADIDKQNAEEMNKRSGKKQTLEHLLSPDHGASADKTVNEWQKIGAFIGSAADPAIVSAQRSEQHLQQIKLHVEEIKKSISDAKQSRVKLPPFSMVSQNSPEWNP